jgi:Putative lumazine-binding
MGDGGWAAETAKSEGFFMTLGRWVAVALVLCGSATTARAQEPEKAAVLAVVQKVFDAMRTRDTSLLSVAFDTTARLVGVGRDGNLSLTPASRFGAAIVRAPAGDVWNERIFDPEVRIDGDVAQVWAYYTFHANKQFSHCGVDAFMLRKVGSQWKITQLSDSRRTTGCTHTEPPG